MRPGPPAVSMYNFDTMSVLKSVALKGVWDEKDFSYNFHPDINFLIGPNGSGKTTVINLIVAALTADYDALNRVPFQSIICEFSQEGKKKDVPSLSVERVL